MVVLNIKTTSRTEFVDITSKVQETIDSTGLTEGLCLLYVPHTTAAITINESADPSVKADILM
ncbi:MAG: secondary thiamine-phosphate synthase enzyme YjbQ, partial [Desulfobacterales bacterium]